MPDDLSSESAVDWDREISSNKDLVRTSDLAGEEKTQHIQGLSTSELREKGIRESSVGRSLGESFDDKNTKYRVDHLCLTKRDLPPPTGRLTFGPLRGDVPDFLNHKPFKGKKGATDD